MAMQSSGALSGELADAAARFARWRSRRVRGERIPESLWDLAVSLAGKHGVSQTSVALQVGYYSLKKRWLGKRHSDNDGVSDSSSLAGFVEWPASTLATSSECLIEFEKASGAKFRVQLKGQRLPDLLALGRAFWEAG